MQEDRDNKQVLVGWMSNPSSDPLCRSMSLMQLAYHASTMHLTIALCGGSPLESNDVGPERQLSGQ